MKSGNRLVFVLTLLGVLMTGYSQNLVQNPSFESPVSWDDLWILSTTDPSTATAVASEITTDAHEGSKSLELSNLIDKEWTYFYTDSVNAPISFIANQRYEVKGWIKSVEKGKKVELSLVWNNKQDALIFYNGNPDPVANPDWFMVNATITASADFNDGFLSLGFQNDKSGGLPFGKLLLDDFSVTRIPSTFTEIIDFSLPEQTGPAVINIPLHTVVVEVPFGTDVTALVPTIDLSLGAASNPASGVAYDFTTPVVYTVTAEDGVTMQDWTVTVKLAPPSTKTDILRFDLAEQTGPPAIDNVLHNVITEVSYGTDVTAMVPTIELSPGATIQPASGVAVDFSVPVIYLVTAENGITFQNFIVAAMVSTISNETDIVSFTLPGQAGPATIDDQLHTVSIKVPYSTDVTALVPTIGVSARASMSPASGVTADFSTPVVYTVTAEDGVAKQDWTTTVIVLLNTETDIVYFTIAEQSGPATIDNLLHTVSIDVPYATDVAALVPTIGLPAGATINPPSNVAGDFSSSIIYTVTAEDGVNTQDWTTTVNVLLNTETDIVDFTLAGQTGPADIDNLLQTVSIDVPFGTDVTGMIPTIGLSAGASIHPASGVSEDFSNPVVYTVTSEDGTTAQEWTAVVIVLPNAETDIVDFTLAEEIGPATIDNLLHTVSIDVPIDTDVTTLVPTIQLSAGATVNPASGVPIDFSTLAVFTVTAVDGITTQDWTVTVNVLPNTEAAIEDFILAEQRGPATISDLLHAVFIDVPYGTDVTALVPSILLSSGATIDPASGVSTDFSSTVVYTVTAADGTTSQDWMVNVIVSLNKETDILSFALAEQTGPATIDNLMHTVEIEVAKETALSALVPAIGLSEGATIDPMSGVAADFSSTVVFTVTAEDGVTTQDWSVSVTLDPAVSVEPVHDILSIQVYPNPAREVLFVELPGKGDIFVQDIMGRVVTTISDASAKTTIPVSDLDRGTYFIQVIWDEFKHVSKIILE